MNHWTMKSDQIIATETPRVFSGPQIGGVISKGNGTPYFRET